MKIPFKYLVVLLLSIILPPSFIYAQSFDYKRTIYTSPEVSGATIKNSFQTYLMANTANTILSPTPTLNNGLNTGSPCSWGILSPSSFQNNSANNLDFQNLFLESKVDFSTYPNNDFDLKSLRASIKVEHDYNLHMKTVPYVYEFEVKVTRYPSMVCTNPTISTEKLLLGYHPDGIYAFQDKSIIQFNGAYAIQVQIINIRDVTAQHFPNGVTTNIYNPPSTNVYTNFANAPYSFFENAKIANMQTNWKVSVNIEYQKLVKNIPSATPATVYSNTMNGIVLNPSHTSLLPNENKLRVDWKLNANNELPAPALFELEWVYVDDYLVTINNGVANLGVKGGLKYDFKEDATRIITKETSYDIPLIYKRGYVIYRVRMIRPDFWNKEYKKYSPWSIANDNGTILSLVCGTPPCPGLFQISDPHMADGMNWNYQVSYAEDGKSKGVLTYHDGLLKNKQSVTRFSTSPNTLIVAEPFYNYEGGVGIQSLPIPLIQESTDKNFKYQPGFILKDGSTQPYIPSDFDQLGQVFTSGGPNAFPKIDNSSLAAKYYSSSNPLLSIPNAPLNYKSIPDAEGYPIIQTEFSVDDPSRIKRQSGAGAALALGKNHETKYFYMDPDQFEIDEYFGLNIGVSKFYEKAITKDPNGQYSFSISNNAGKPVMTGLMGWYNANIDPAYPIKPMDGVSFSTGTYPFINLNRDHPKTNWQGNVYQFNKTKFNEVGTAELKLKVNLKKFNYCTSLNSALTIFPPELKSDLKVDFSVTANPTFVSPSINLSGANDIVWISSPYSLSNLPDGDESIIDVKVSYDIDAIDQKVDDYISHPDFCGPKLSDYLDDALDNLPEDPCAITEQDENSSTSCGIRTGQMEQQVSPGQLYASYRYYGNNKKYPIGNWRSLFCVVGWKVNNVMVSTTTNNTHYSTPSLSWSANVSEDMKDVYYEPMVFPNSNIPASVQSQLNNLLSTAMSNTVPVYPAMLPSDPPLQLPVGNPMNLSTIQSKWDAYYDLLFQYAEPVYLYQSFPNTGFQNTSANDIINSQAEAFASAFTVKHPEYCLSLAQYCDDLAGKAFVEKLESIPNYDMAVKMGYASLGAIQGKDPHAAWLGSNSIPTDDINLVYLDQNIITPAPSVSSIEIDKMAFAMLICEGATDISCLTNISIVNLTNLTNKQKDAYFNYLRTLYLAGRGLSIGRRWAITQSCSNPVVVSMGNIQWSTDPASNNNVVVGEFHNSRIFKKYLQDAGSPSGPPDLVAGAPIPASTTWPPSSVLSNTNVANDDANIVAFAESIVEMLGSCTRTVSANNHYLYEGLPLSFPSQIFDPAYYNGLTVPTNCQEQLKNDLIAFMRMNFNTMNDRLWLGGMTPFALKNILLRRGINLDDLCNPYLINYLASARGEQNEDFCDYKDLLRAMRRSEGFGAPSIDIMKALFVEENSCPGGNTNCTIPLSGTTLIDLKTIENAVPSNSANEFDNFIFTALEMNGSGYYQVNCNWELEIEKNTIPDNTKVNNYTKPLKYKLTLTNNNPDPSFNNGKTVVLEYNLKNAVSNNGVYWSNAQTPCSPTFGTHWSTTSIDNVVSANPLLTWDGIVPATSNPQYNVQISSSNFNLDYNPQLASSNCIKTVNPNVGYFSTSTNPTNCNTGGFYVSDCNSSDFTKGKIVLDAVYSNSAMFKDGIIFKGCGNPSAINQDMGLRSYFEYELSISGAESAFSPKYECVTPYEFKNEYENYQSDVQNNSLWAIKGERHPYYEKSVKSYFNYKFRKKNEALKYINFMEGCNLSDYFTLPSFYDYVQVQSSSASAVNGFRNALESTTITIPSSTPVSIAMNNLNYLQFNKGGVEYLYIFMQDVVNKPAYLRPLIQKISTLATTNNVTLHVNKLEHEINLAEEYKLDVLVAPGAAVNFSSVSSNPAVNLSMAASTITVGTANYNYDLYSFVMTSPTTTGMANIVKEIYDVIYNSSLQPLAHAIRSTHRSHKLLDDNNQIDKQSYLTHAYSNSNAIKIHDDIIADLKRPVLYSNVYNGIYSAGGGDGISYLNPLNPQSNSLNEDEHLSGTLYLTAHPTNTNGKNFLNYCLTNKFTYSACNYGAQVSACGSSPNIGGRIFYEKPQYFAPASSFSSSFTVPTGMSFTGHQFKFVPRMMEDNIYWYKIQGVSANANEFHNVYIKIPNFLNLQDLYDFTIVPNSLKVLHTEENGSKAFTVDFQSNSTTCFITPITFTAIGRTDFDLDNSTPKAYEYVMLCDGDGNDNSLFSPCFDNILEQANQQAQAQYALEREKVKQKVKESFITHIQDNLTLDVLWKQPQKKYAVTLYGYDRVGNLIYTTPPGGVETVLNTQDNMNNLVEERNESTYYNSFTAPADVVVNGILQKEYLPKHRKMSTYHYNSLNQLISQNTPDGGETKFYYDPSGKLCFSQNAKQAIASNGSIPRYSYTLYDDQNRIIETGEIAKSTEVGLLVLDLANYEFEFTQQIDGQTVGITERCNAVIRNLIYGKERYEVVRTKYDDIIYDFSNNGATGMSEQDNLRGRVASITYHDMYKPNTATVPDLFNMKIGIHYSYDISGNVKTLTYDMPALAKLHQRYKRIDYDYDLYSGKVNMVSYNRGFTDQFYQRYEYDADNRITKVESSQEGIIWDNDANYNYFPHGPLARISLGDLQVQGIDFAYTLQGWLKSINGDSPNPMRDMGGDNVAQSVNAAGHANHLKDMLQMALFYYEGDYKPIDNTDNDPGTSQKLLSTPDLPGVRSLYNGNIAATLTGPGNFEPLYTNYWYDQLNRIKDAQYLIPDIQANGDAILKKMSDFSWMAGNWQLPGSNSGIGIDDLYRSQYTYDFDGNLTSLKRNGLHKPSGASEFDISGKGMASPVPMQSYVMDDLTYAYKATSPSAPSPNSAYDNNKLVNFQDLADHAGTTSDNDLIRFPITGSLSSSDLVNTPRFKYDEIGNLVKDNTGDASAGKSLEILWNLYGKVKGINYKNGTQIDQTETFAYEPGGQRYMKSLSKANVNDPTHTDYLNEYYIRDASGNILAIYKQKEEVAYVNPFVSLASQTLSKTDFGTVYNQLVQGTGMFETKLQTDILSSYASFASAQNAAHPASFYLSNNADAKTALVQNSETLIEDLLANAQMQMLVNTSNTAFDQSFMEPIWYEQDAQVQDAYIIALVDAGDITQMQSIMEMISPGAYNIQQEQDFTTAFKTEMVRNDMVAILDQLSLWYEVNGNNTYWENTLTRLFDIFEYRSHNYTELSFGTVSNYLKGKLAQTGDNAVLGAYFDGLSNSTSYLNEQVSQGVQLNTVYNNDPVMFLDAFKSETNAATAIGDALYEAFGANFGGVVLQLGDIAPSWQGELALSASVLKEEFYLAEHHLYGSSRLGIKNYFPNHYNFLWEASSNPTNPSFAAAVAANDLLDKRKPWYSYKMNNLMQANSIKEYLNENGDKVVANRVIGMKHYELTNHLGNVMAVVTDKRADVANDGSGDPLPQAALPSTTAVASNSLYAAYDYYPFGMLMPNRYLSNNVTQCTPVSITSYNTTWVDMLLLDLSNSSSISNFDVASATQVNLDTDEGVLRVNAENQEEIVEVSVTLSNVQADKEVQIATTVVNNNTTGELVQIKLEQQDAQGAWILLSSTTVASNADVVLSGTTNGTGALKVSYSSLGAFFDVHSFHYQRQDVYASTSTRLVCSNDGDDYRFGFNGQHKENEIAGIGNHNTALFWEYDTRLGRRWNIDPIDQIGTSNYAAFYNNPIVFSDVLGDTPGDGDGDKDKKKDNGSDNKSAGELNKKRSDGTYPHGRFGSFKTEDGTEIHDKVDVKTKTVKVGNKPWVPGVDNGNYVDVDYAYKITRTIYYKGQACSTMVFHPEEPKNEKNTILGYDCTATFDALDWNNPNNPDYNLVRLNTGMLEASVGFRPFPSLTKIMNTEVAVFRVYGGGSPKFGSYWSPINPAIYGKYYRNFAGLPNINSGQYIIQGTTKLKNLRNLRMAAPLDGNFGRLVPEVKITFSQNKVIQKSIGFSRY